MARCNQPLIGGAVLAAALVSGGLAAQLDAQTVAAEPVWKTGLVLQRPVAGNAPDVLRIRLAQGWLVIFEAMQSGTDLAVSLRDPAGQTVAEANAFNGRYGPETLAAISGTGGEFRLEVRTDNPQAGPSEYTLRVRELRPATTGDGDLVAAYAAYQQGLKLAAARTATGTSQAMEQFRRAHDFFSRSGDRYMDGLVTYELGVRVRNTDNPSALRWFREAADSFHAVADRRLEASALNSVGGALSIQGEPQEALRFYQQALALFVAVGESWDQANQLNNIGLAEARLARWQSALDSYRKALEIFRELKNPAAQAVVFNNLGAAYQDLGDSDEALRLFEQALVLRRALPDRRLLANTLSNLASIHLDRGEPGRSLTYLNEGLAIRVSIGDKRSEASTRALQGRALAALRRFDEAQAALLRSLELAQSVGDRRGAAIAMLHLATTTLATKESAKAVEWGLKAYAGLDGLGDRTLEALALEAIGRAENAAGDLAKARQHLGEALRITESARTGVDSQQLRASFFATRQDAHGTYIDLLMRMGEGALALESSERSRARSLLEMMASSASAIREGADAKLLERERDISNLLNAKGGRLLELNAANPQAEGLRREVRDLQSEYQDVQSAIRKSSPRYAALTQPSVLTASQIQADVLDDDTLLLEYSLGEERSYLWVVGKRTLRSFELPARDKIEAAARKVSQLLAVRADAPLAIAARELSEMVIGKAAAVLGNKRLVIVPDGALQSLPFAMLPWPGTREPLLVRHELVTLPSASALAVLRTQTTGRATAPKMLAVFADPVFGTDDSRVEGGKTIVALNRSPDASRILDHLAGDSGQQAISTLKIPRLPYTAQEADQILNVAKSASNLRAVGFQANRATAIGGQLSEYRYLHFATHGYLDTERPSLSALVLAQIDEKGQAEDGFLRVNDIYNARLAADLVVLSACQTGLGKEVRGEGLMGLTRAFLYAGVPRVVVSLWNVNDRATAELMAAFYKSMLRDGKRPSAALRAAQLELRKQKRWESPYYWAAFVEHGEWK